VDGERKLRAYLETPVQPSALPVTVEISVEMLQDLLEKEFKQKVGWDRVRRIHALLAGKKA
jgi:hypothetical protein